MLRAVASHGQCSGESALSFALLPSNNPTANAPLKASPAAVVSTAQNRVSNVNNLLTFQQFREVKSVGSANGPMWNRFVLWMREMDALRRSNLFPSVA